jgi:hypothetical protein
MPGVTTNGPTADDLSAVDQVLYLREWATDRQHLLPSAPTARCAVGTAETCTVRLTDSSVSPIHAHLRRDSRRWSIRALGRDLGLLQDGARCDAFALEPGVEIGVGSTTLIAESMHSVDLRAFCARILGWSDDRAPIVDRALRSIRLAAARRTALWLCGEGDLVPLAQSLHRHAFGADRPFVVCDPRRGDPKGSVRQPANCETGTAAVQAAIGGSLCVRRARLPRDFSSVLLRVRDPSVRVLLIVCADRVDLDGALITGPIEVPPLHERATELPRIIDEYAFDAVAALRELPDSFTSTDRAWVLEHAATSLPEIEKATLRRVALNTCRSINRAAKRLGMSQVSLARWLGRRK